MEQLYILTNVNGAVAFPVRLCIIPAQYDTISASPWGGRTNLRLLGLDCSPRDVKSSETKSQGKMLVRLMISVGGKLMVLIRNV